jgi:hypothetical protein
MAYFSKLDANNKVINSIRVEDSVITENDSLSEEKGQSFLRKIFNEPDAIWKRTVKGMTGGVNQNGGEVFRKNFGAVDSTYDAARDAFIPVQLINPDGTECTTTIFNEDKCIWETPTPQPTEPAASIWLYADIGGWKRLDVVSEGKKWEYNSTDGWAEVDI